jgi:hypothetical protein
MSGTNTSGVGRVRHQFRGGQAGIGIDEVGVVARHLVLVEVVPGQLQVALGFPAEQLPVVAVGEQQFGLVRGQHRHSRVQAFQHRREAVVRGGEFLAGALRLGDVRHRAHPARMAATAVDQRRHVHAGEEAAAVTAHDAHFIAGGRRLALQRQVDLLLHFLLVVGRPVGKGGTRPTRSLSVQPVMRQNAGFT